MWRTAWIRRSAIQGGTPESITVDNGSEFCSQVMDTWAYRNEVLLDFIRPGKPVENCFIESFNGRVRDECLNVHWFETLDEARVILEDWRKDYNEVRPHSSLSDQVPKAYLEELRDQVARLTEANRAMVGDAGLVNTAMMAEVEAMRERAKEDIAQAKDAALAEVFSSVNGQVASATERVLGRALSDADQDRLISEALAEISA